MPPYLNQSWADRFLEHRYAMPFISGSGNRYATPLEGCISNFSVSYRSKCSFLSSPCMKFVSVPQNQRSLNLLVYYLHPSSVGIRKFDHWRSGTMRRNVRTFSPLRTLCKNPATLQYARNHKRHAAYAKVAGLADVAGNFRYGETSVSALDNCF